MAIPNLKRIKVASKQELSNWAAKNSDHDAEVMIVTCSKKSPKKYVSGAEVRDALGAQGWTVSRSYTLEGGLVGHVVSAA